MSPMTVPASVHDPASWAGLGVDATRRRRFANAFLKRFRPLEEALALLPEAVRGRFREAHPLELERRADSTRDGASKLLFRTRDGRRIETVILRIATGRTTLCLSSQAGCAAACVFCATGRMGLARNLSAGEVLDQVVQAGGLLRPEGRRPKNLVFMGMGEPLHNEEALHEALGRLQAGDGFHVDGRRILVSTVGVPEGMRRLAKAHPRVGQALSLHAARPEVRERLVPPARRTPLGDLRSAVEEVARRTGRPVMIEVLLLAGENDGDEDLEALAAWVDGLDVHVNLIPYNPVEGVELEASPRARIEAFSRELKRRGRRVTTRYSLGADIAAACGQLARGKG